MRISDWSSDVCSSDLAEQQHGAGDGDHRLHVEHQGSAQGAGVAHRADHGEEGAQEAEADVGEGAPAESARSEEHTSELQSLMRISYAVFCLKKNIRRGYAYSTSEL